MLFLEREPSENFLTRVYKEREVGKEVDVEDIAERGREFLPARLLLFVIGELCCGFGDCGWEVEWDEFEGGKGGRGAEERGRASGGAIVG